MIVKTIKDLINEGIEDCCAFVCSNLNVSLKDGVVADPGQVDASPSTLSALIDVDTKVVVVAHPGRPRGEIKPEFSLAPTVEAPSECLEQYAVLADHVSGEDVHEHVNGLTEGGVFLLENAHFDPRETSRDEAERAEFVAELVALVPDGAFVSNGFGVVHRVQTFVFDVARRLPHYAGNLAQAEPEVLRRVAETPEEPYTVVLGRPRVSDKLGVIKTLAPKVDPLITDGGVCFTFLVVKGCVVSSSLPQEEVIDTCKDLLDRHGDKIVLSTDIAVADKFAADAENKIVEATETPEGWIGLDIGPASTEAFGKVSARSKAVFWNSPMGVSEMEAFAASTHEVAQAIIDMITGNGCFSVVDGDDSVVAVRTLELNEEGFSRISTGSDASSKFLEGKTLSGASVLED